jgi:hypothetical protein
MRSPGPDHKSHRRHGWIPQISAFPHCRPRSCFILSLSMAIYASRPGVAPAPRRSGIAAIPFSPADIEQSDVPHRWFTWTCHRCHQSNPSRGLMGVIHKSRFGLYGHELTPKVCPLCSIDPTPIRKQHGFHLGPSVSLCSLRLRHADGGSSERSGSNWRID